MLLFFRNDSIFKLNMKTEDAAKLVDKTLRGWTVVGAPVAQDSAAVSPKKTSPNLFTLVKKYSNASDAAPSTVKHIKLKTNGVSIVRVRPNKQGQDAPNYTKGVVVGDAGIIGMEG